MIGRRMLTTGVVVAAVATGGIGGAVLGVPGLLGASTSSTTAPKADGTPRSRPHFRGGPGLGAGEGVLDAGAKALKLSTDDLLSKLSDGKTTIADVAKQQKVDVKTVIDAMDAVAKSDIKDLVNNPFPMPPFGGAPGKAPMGGPGAGRRGGLRGGLHTSFDAMAKALGITTDDLMADLRKGQSIADIAKTKKIGVSALIGTLVNDAKSKLDAAVKAGELTSDQATKVEAELHDRITALVNGSGPKRSRGFGGPDGFRGPGRGGAPPNASSTPS